MYKGNEGEYESASNNVLPTLFINNNRNAYNRHCMCMWVRKESWHDGMLQGS